MLSLAKMMTDFEINSLRQACNIVKGVKLGTPRVLARDSTYSRRERDVLLDSRNVLDVLQQAGRQGGYHAFRRFRFAVLRKTGVPDDLIKQWLGHSQNLIDLYAAQLRYDETYRREWCEKAGLGFELGELGYKSMASIRPSLVA